jgi:hypothetical protein
MNTRTVWAAAALSVVLFVAWLALRPPPLAPVAAARPPARVVLPPAPAPAPDAVPALAELAASRMWGPRAARAGTAAASAASGADVAPEPAWFLSGVYGPAGQRVLVVRYEAQARPALQLRVGQRLPDGARIETIDIDRVQVRPAPAAGKGRPKLQWLPVNRGLPVPDN